VDFGEFGSYSRHSEPVVVEYEPSWMDRFLG